MSYLIFENPGVIDLLTISTFGVSVKETDNPIGFFGTGLKYAVAIALRTGHNVVLQAGMNEYPFYLKNETIRGKTFDMVYMSDIQLPFTTLMGQNWDTWQAYRELWSNTRDENGTVYVADKIPAVTEGVTRFVVQGDPLLKIHNNRSAFILVDRTPIATLGTGVEVYEGENTSIFYKGFCVFTLPQNPEGKQVKTRYTWNVTRQVDLTEDRTAKWPSLLPSYVSSALLGCTDEKFLAEIVTLGKEYWEHKFDYTYNGSYFAKPGTTFMATLDKVALHHVADINKSAIEVYREIKQETIEPAKTKLSRVEERILAKAARFVRDVVGLPVDEYVIMVTDQLGERTRGLAKDHTIYVSRLAFDAGAATVAGVLVEEFCHLRYGYQDESREFQNFLLGLAIRMAQRNRKRPL
jgi:hypothetical protein